MAQGDKKPVIMEADIGVEGGVPPYLHASQHSASGTDPITPHMIGALPIIDARSADYDMDIIIASGRHCGMYETDNKTLGTPYAKGIIASTAATIFSWSNTDNGNFGHQFAFVSGNMTYVRYLTATNGLTGWQRCATTDYAVNKAGDTMTGDLHIIGDRTHPKLDLYSTSDGRSDSAWLENEQNNFCFNITNDRDNGVLANRRQIKFYNSNGQNLAQALRLIDVVDDVYTTYPILHTGNKPSGSYTGNGDATTRTIATGGIGNLVFVLSGNSIVFITASGAICFEINTTAVRTVPCAEAHFANGVITLATSSSTSMGALNYSGATYTYQVL